MHDNEARLNRRFINLKKLLIVYVSHFPSYQKFALSNRILNAAVDVYELMIKAQMLYQKQAALRDLNIRHEQLRMLVLLAHEMGYFKHATRNKPDPEGEAARRYLAISRHIDEVGRLIGGWIAADKRKQTAKQAE